MAGFEYTNYIADNLTSSHNGIPLFKGKNVKNGLIDYTFESFIPERISNQLWRSQITKKCLLTPYVGAIGNVGIHNKEGKYHLGSNVGKIEVGNENGIIVLEEFLRYYLMSSYGYKELSKHKKATAQESISIEAIRDVILPVCSLSMQRQIVHIVEQWFSFLDFLEKQVAELDQAISAIKSTILDLAIHGKLVPQDPNDEPAIDLLRRINPDFEPCDNAHYERLSEGWTCCLLENVANVLDNKRQPIKTEERKKRVQGKSQIYPYYGATGIAGNIDDYLLEGRYILLGEDGAPFLDKDAYKAYEVNGRFWVNNHAHILEPKIDFLFLLHYLNAIDYADYVKGTTRLKLTQADMNNIKIILPPLPEQHRIVAKIEQLFAMLDKIKESLEA